MVPSTARLVTLALLASASAPHPAAARQTHSLDGAAWHLTLDPADPATVRIKLQNGKTAGPVTVPGAWENQGFGEATTTMKHQYIGVGTYQCTVAVPPAFASPPAGSTVWLVVERIQRAAKISVGTAVIGQHMGYLSPFEGDVTSHIKDGKLDLTIEVNATRHKGVDGLMGEADLETDGTGLGGWGGLGGHVTLELRGKGWIISPHIQHALAEDMKSAVVNATMEVGGQQAGTGFIMRVTFSECIFIQK